MIAAAGAIGFFTIFGKYAYNSLFPKKNESIEVLEEKSPNDNLLFYLKHKYEKYSIIDMDLNKILFDKITGKLKFHVILKNNKTKKVSLTKSKDGESFDYVYKMYLEQVKVTCKKMPLALREKPEYDDDKERNIELFNKGIN